MIALTMFYVRIGRFGVDRPEYLHARDASTAAWAACHSTFRHPDDPPVVVSVRLAGADAWLRFSVDQAHATPIR